MKKKQQKSNLNEFIVGLGVSAGILGMMNILFKRQMEMMGMLDGISVKELIAGMVSAYNDLLKEKDDEIKELEQKIKDRELEIKGFNGVIEDLNKDIKTLQEKLKEKKKAKSEKKEEEPEPKLM